jgi:hypothetical protein
LSAFTDFCQRPCSACWQWSTSETITVFLGNAPAMGLSLGIDYISLLTWSTPNTSTLKSKNSRGQLLQLTSVQIEGWHFFLKGISNVYLKIPIHSYTSK